MSGVPCARLQFKTKNVFCVQLRGVRDPRCASARLVLGGGRLRHVRHPALRGRVGRTAPRRRRPARHRRQTV